MFATNNLFRGTADPFVITNGHGNVHSRKKGENPDVLGRYVGCVPFIHTVIKKNLLEWKTIQSITMRITRKMKGRNGGKGSHLGSRDCSMPCVGKKPFSR